MNKDTASRRGSAAERLPRGAGGEAGEGAYLHLHWTAQKLINLFLIKCCSVHLSVHAGPSSVNLLSVPGTPAAFLAPLALRSMAGSQQLFRLGLQCLSDPSPLTPGCFHGQSPSEGPGLPLPRHPLGREGPEFPFVCTCLGRNRLESSLSSKAPFHCLFSNILV